MNRREFAEAILRMQEVEGAEVHIKDNGAESGQRSYRYAALKAEIPHLEAMRNVAHWMQLALDIRGYFSVHTSTSQCWFQVAVSLTLDEAPAVDGAAVSVGTVLKEGGFGFEARLEGDPFVWGRGDTEQEAVRDAKEPLQDSGSKDVEMDLGRLVVTEVRS